MAAPKMQDFQGGKAISAFRYQAFFMDSGWATEKRLGRGMACADM